MNKVNRPRHIQAEREYQRKKKHKQLILGHIQYFLSVSSIHGLSHIVRSRRAFFERLFWICAVLGGLAFGLLKGYEVFMHYYQRPFVISVEVDHKNFKNEFPSVSICQKTLIPDDEIEKVMNQRGIPFNESVVSYLRDLAFTNYYSYKYLEAYANGSQMEYLDPEEYIPVLLKVVETIPISLSAKQDSNTIKFPFGEHRPVYTSLTELGVCMTINPSTGVYYSSEYLNSTRPYDYEPIVYNYTIMNMKYFLQDIPGDYMVILHSPHEMIDITSKTLPGTYVRKTTVNFECISVWTTDDVKELSLMQRQCKLKDDVDGMDHSPVYSYILCRIECRIKLCLKYCNCTPYYYRRNPGEKICDMAGMYCLSQYEDELVYLYSSKTNESICNCVQNCNENLVYTTKYTTANWLMTTVLVVELDEAPNVRYVRKLVFSKTDLLVQIGGILGLCLGSSILSIIEIIYFATLRLYWCVAGGKSIKNAL